MKATKSDAQHAAKSKTHTDERNSAVHAKDGEDLSPLDDESAPLGAREQRFLARVAKLLLGMQTPSVIVRARRAGYSDGEHREGWRLWRIAAGEGRPLDHWFAKSAEQQLDHTPNGALLQRLDTFENTWLPRTRAIIRRVVPRDQRDEFESAFFGDLTQQPLGPAVIASVATFIARVDALATSKAPNARDVRDMLRARGLDDAHLDEARKILTALQQAAAPRSEHKNTDPREIDRAAREQRDAYEGLRDWYNDWATTLRTVFGARQQITLGLTTIASSSGNPVETDETGDAGDSDTAAPKESVPRG